MGAVKNGERYATRRSGEGWFGGVTRFLKPNSGDREGLGVPREALSVPRSPGGRSGDISGALWGPSRVLGGKSDEKPLVFYRF